MEFKFRAWNTRRNEMEYINDLYWFEENGVHENGDNDYQLMQYTGEEDDNSKMIYEGDILKYECCSRGENHTVVVGNKNFEVEVCGMDYDYTTLEWSGILDSDYLGVVGNIYENKEMMEGFEI